MNIGKESLKCNAEWPVCVHDIEYTSKISNFLVLKPYHNNIEIIDEYFNNKFKKSYSNNNNCQTPLVNVSQFIDYRNILIERRPHLCEKISFNQDELNEPLLFKKGELKKNYEINQDELEFQKKMCGRIRSNSYEFFETTTLEYNKFIRRINDKCKYLFLNFS